AQIEGPQNQPIADDHLMEMGDKVNRYKLLDKYKETACQIQLHQFYLETPEGDIFGTGEELLNQEALLKNFKLSNEDNNIDFEQIASDLYKVDIEKVGKDEYTPRFTKIEDQQVKDPMVEYILAKPKENQVKDIAHQLIQ